jgi:hypothetical protein
VCFQSSRLHTCPMASVPIRPCVSIGELSHVVLDVLERVHYVRFASSSRSKVECVGKLTWRVILPCIRSHQSTLIITSKLRITVPSCSRSRPHVHRLRVSSSTFLCDDCVCIGHFYGFLSRPSYARSIRRNPRIGQSRIKPD